MELTSFYDGEKWYLRLILKSSPCNSFTDMKTWNNNTYNTYQESAIARGLVADQHECFQVFDESYRFHTPRQRRSLFAILTIHGFPTICIFNNDVFRESMQEDFHGPNAYNNMLIDISKRLKNECQNMAYLNLRMKKLNFNLKCYDLIMRIFYLNIIL